MIQVLKVIDLSCSLNIKDNRKRRSIKICFIPHTTLHEQLPTGKIKYNERFDITLSYQIHAFIRNLT